MQNPIPNGTPVKFLRHFHSTDIYDAIISQSFNKFGGGYFYIIEVDTPFVVGFADSDEIFTDFKAAEKLSTLYKIEQIYIDLINLKNQQQEIVKKIIASEINMRKLIKLQDTLC